MTTRTSKAFPVAAAALPLVVGAFFLLASAVPRWTVPPAAYDAVIETARPYRSQPYRVMVRFDIRDGRVEATMTAPKPETYPQPPTLLLVDHVTLKARELVVDLPETLAEGETERRVTVAALQGLRVVADLTAPDGYALRTRDSRGPGLLGDLFGMRSYRQRVALVRDSRAMPVDMPPPFQDSYQPIRLVGWVVPEAR